MNRQSDISGRIRQWLVNGGTHWWKTGSRLRKKKKMKSPSPMRNSHDFISKGETEQKHHTESWKAALTRGSGFYPVAPCKIENQGTESAPQNQGEHPPVSRPPAGGEQRKHWHSPKRTNRNWSIHTFSQNVSKSPTPRPAHTGKWSGLIAKESKKLDRIQKAIQRSEVFKNVFDEDWVAFWWLILIDFLIDSPPTGGGNLQFIAVCTPELKIEIALKNFYLSDSNIFYFWKRLALKRSFLS